MGEKEGTQPLYLPSPGKFKKWGGDIEPKIPIEVYTYDLKNLKKWMIMTKRRWRNHDSGIGTSTFLREKVLPSKRSACIEHCELSHILFYRATNPPKFLNSFVANPTTGPRPNRGVGGPQGYANAKHQHSDFISVVKTCEKIINGIASNFWQNNRNIIKKLAYKF